MTKKATKAAPMVRLDARVPVALAAAVADRARRDVRSVAYVVRAALEAYLAPRRGRRP